MPIYEYACALCGKHTEVIQKVDEAPLVDCPACGASGLQRLMSSAAFQLKGKGWYVTDFRDKKTTDSTTQQGNTDNNSTTTETKSTVEQPASKEE